jgi:hypothetical protein
MKVAGVFVFIVFAISGVTLAQSTQLLHVSGYAWETGGFPVSDAGDNLTVVGTLNEVEEPLVWDTSNHSHTLWIRDLVSEGEFVIGTFHVVVYTGGLFTIYVDSLPSNHDYGINPPNATAPSTFMDGSSTYLEGFFWNFTLTFNEATESGSFVGEVEFTGGDVFSLLPQTCLTFGADIANVAPAGYDLQMNGDVNLPVTRGGCGSVPVQSHSWGRIKSLYR